METERQPVGPHRFREVLGHFPTGVALITAIDNDGQPVGLTVGSFTSVSLDPPLVAYLPAKASTRFERMRSATSFCVNILAADQEQVCRDFARSGADAFVAPVGPVQWQPTPSGSPRLDGVVGWIDCTTESVQEAGDHWLVIGRITDLGVENPTIPLLFFQGGYGAFAPRALVVSPREQLETQVRLADLVRDDLSDLAEEMRAEISAVAIANDEQVLVATTRPVQSRSVPMRVGGRLPLMPPWSAVYLAWEPAQKIELHCASVVPALTAGRRAQFERDLAMIRRDGWALSYRDNEEDMSELARLLESQQRVGPTPAIRRSLAEVVSRMSPPADPTALQEYASDAGFSVTVPLFDAQGHVPMLLVAFDLPEDTTTAGVLHCRDRLVDTATNATARSGGVPPQAYVVLK